MDVELELWPETPHVFQMAPFLPESKLAITQIASFVIQRTGWQAPATVPVVPACRPAVANA